MPPAVWRLGSMPSWDVRLQVRYGLYTVYAVLTLVYVLGLRALGPALRTEATVLLIVTDPTVLGFYFIAAMVLFEKDAGVLNALVTTPLGDRGYLLSKVVTLSLLAVVASTLVAVVGHGSVGGLVVLIPGVALSAAFFVLIGFVAVARYDSVNEYFISAVGWGTILFLPLFGYLGFVETPLFYLLPAQPVLVLVEAAFRPVPWWALTYAFGYLLVANVIAFAVARRAFRRHIVRGGGSGKPLGQARLDRSRRRETVRSPWIGLVRADLRNWTRDPMLAFAAIGPVALALVIRVGAPTVAAMIGPSYDLTSVYPVLGGTMTIFGAAIYGFIVGMFVLEDREQGVLTAYRVSPLSPGGYLVYRGITAFVLALVATLPAVAVVGIVTIPVPVLVGASAVGALGGPVLALAFGTLANNTIEGIALSKLVNLVVLGPALGIAVVPEPFQFVAGVSPTYWPVKAVIVGLDGNPIWPLYLLIGVISHGIALTILIRWFTARGD